MRRSRRRWWRCLWHQTIRCTAAARTISIDDRQICCFFGKFSQIVYDRRSFDFDAFSFEHVLLSGQGALSVRFTWNIRYSIALSVQFCIGIGLGYARTYSVKQSTKENIQMHLVQSLFDFDSDFCFLLLFTGFEWNLANHLPMPNRPKKLCDFFFFGIRCTVPFSPPLIFAHSLFTRHTASNRNCIECKDEIKEKKLTLNHLQHRKCSVSVSSIEAVHSFCRLLL